jgi:membrane associated rhomboid family serine protease
VFVPIYDENPLRRISFQYANLLLIALNVIVFVVFQARDVWYGQECNALLFSKAFGIIPMELTGIQVNFEGCPVAVSGSLAMPEPLTLLSYMFLHGDIWHLLGNMLFLWVFGDNVEDALGHVRYVIFYLLCGIAGGLLHTVLSPGATAPLIGASGAVSGVVVAYLLLHPRVHLWVLVLRVIPLQVPAFLALGAWIGMNLVLAFLPSIQPLVAWWAHVGGMVAGAVLILVMRPSGVALFQGPPVRR